jgi:hypothetical protein
MFFCTRKYSSHFRSEVWARGYHLTCTQSSTVIFRGSRRRPLDVRQAQPTPVCSALNREKFLRCKAREAVSHLEEEETAQLVVLQRSRASRFCQRGV